jgi:hypothetical protein
MSDEEKPKKMIWCVFGVMRETRALSFLGELVRDRGTYTLKLSHAGACSRRSRRRASARCLRPR